MEKPHKKTAIATVVYPIRSSETNARILIESIRTFGGSLSDIPVWCCVPRIKSNVSFRFRDFCHAAGCQLELFDTSPEALRFPLAADVAGAAYAEEKARDDIDLLIWLGANTIVLQEPGHFIIPSQASVGYCPVHHTNIGSIYDSALDPFWSALYRACEVVEDRVFPMKTQVDGKTLRPYFNATSLVVCPNHGLFARWLDALFTTYQQQEFQKFYEQDERYAIFMHQAVLTGVILATVKLEEMVKLPPSYNYPLHLWREDVTHERPRRLDELVTVRHEGFYNDPNWRDTMPGGDELKNWLGERTA